MESRARILPTFPGRVRALFFYGPPGEPEERERKVPLAAGSPNPCGFPLWEERGNHIVSHWQIAVSPWTRAGMEGSASKRVHRAHPSSPGSQVTRAAGR